MTTTIDGIAFPSAPLEAPAAPESRRRGLLHRLVRGRLDDPPWVRPAFLVLMATTAVLYLWDLGASGWANSFYAAAVEAGAKSWKAFFFGSFDSSNFITVDKPPASLWLMELSARAFGLSSWSMLVPQALEGVATVGLVYAAVRRWFRAPAGLIAGAVVALTPVAALMFRYNNPDALLVLLLTAAGYATIRAIEGGRLRWLMLAGTLVGFGFITKELQALLVVPAIGCAYLVGSDLALRRRLLHLLAGGAAMLAAGGWWALLVSFTPAADRPYIGGSQNNTLWNVIFGYNGLGRLTGNEVGSVTGGPRVTGTNPWGPVGLLRLFGTDFGTQVSWLLPAALALLTAGVLLSWRRPRRDRLRISMILWGGTLLVTGLAVSLSKGIIHPYYTVALAPAMGAVIGIGGTELWTRRREWPARTALGAVVAATSLWAFVLLDEAPDWLPALRYLVVVLGVVSAALLLAVHHLPAWLRRAGVACAVVACSAGAAAFTIDTTLTPHTGAIPSAGPSSAGAFGARPGGGAAAHFGGTGGGGFPGVGGGGFTGVGGRGFPGFGGGGFPGAAGGGLPAAGGPGGLGGANGGAGGPGGLLNGSRPSEALAKLLEADSSKYKWVLAVTGAEQAAGYQLATDLPIMAIGGFNGTDPTPTLAQFEVMVADGEIHYYIATGVGGGASSGSNDPSQIQSWVESHFTSTTVDGVMLYNLTSSS
jgi:4-amino-4-deoxy-L-arabinose transferase-like glycosyltransferase